MRILGIYCGHNASACLLDNGIIEFCIQEERLVNIKNYIGFPLRSIETILNQAKLAANDVDFIAVAGVDAPAMHVNQETFLESFKWQARFMYRCAKSLVNTPLYRVYMSLSKKRFLKTLSLLDVDRKKIVFVDHHLCHAAAAYYGSPWGKEKVLVLTCDGFGDGLCSTVYIGENKKLTKIAETRRGNSIGDIYATTTFLLGMTPSEHEWKVMGLAPYASERSVEKTYEFFKSLLGISKRNPLTFERRLRSSTEVIYPVLRKGLEFYRFDQIAGGLQRATEELVCQWVKNCVHKTGIHKIAAGGGVFMNVKANKRIMELEEVEDIFVFPSCADESTSIGAAYWVYAMKYQEIGKQVDIQPLRGIYLGPSFTDDEVEQAITELEEKSRLKVEYVQDIESRVAELLVGGEIVARCKGRMEFGARALGNRSILADAANYGNVRTINMLVKKRDFWMPFAPVILKEREHDYFVNPKNVSAPYMILSFDSTDKRSEYIAAVHQADLTARPQVLEKSWNPEYYAIVKEFEKKTGKGVLLNTSFNLHGYPIVYGPREALWVFINSGLKNLALGNYLICK
jgi:carbamoyltransferase